MISYLRGKIKLAKEDYVIVDIDGIGYRVFLMTKTLADLRNKDDEVELYIYQHIREDSSDLYGFMNHEELEFFEIITSVSGVGPRIGLVILEMSSIEDLKKAIASSNVDFLTRIPGIGRKKAELIILELKNKMDVLVGGDGDGLSEPDGDAVNALVKLGYSNHEAREALSSVSENIKDSGERIKAALKGLGQK